MNRSCAGLIVVIATCGGRMASAQTGMLEFRFPNGSVYSGGASVDVELWVSMEPTGIVYAWESWAGDVLGDDPSADWGGLSTPFALPGSSVGTPGGGSVSDILLFQWHFPPVVYAKTDNPIMIWHGAWSSADLTPRTVALTTVTTKAGAYYNTPTGPTLLLDEGVGTIHVIPSPWAGVVLGMLGVRRRRSGEGSGGAADVNRDGVIDAFD